ncbi:hypothetical protein SDC9_150643 [bioreactor metagenome]|uniref:Uncharacterized protein n=1 Tax=bioreactor metagenome TaxID=1076179 RepID=A0A645ESB4_9ZZZZ
MFERKIEEWRERKNKNKSKFLFKKEKPVENRLSMIYNNKVYRLIGHTDVLSISMTALRRKTGDRQCVVDTMSSITRKPDIRVASAFCPFVMLHCFGRLGILTDRKRASIRVYCIK